MISRGAGRNTTRPARRLNFYGSRFCSNHQHSISKMRYRQVHLDFHTSEAITGVGARFQAEQFRSALRSGCVDSITLFSKCHHGWSYHPTQEGVMHPHLSFDLLGAQLAAADDEGVATRAYVSVGLDEQLYWKRPEWARRLANGEVPWAHTNDRAGFHLLCLNTGYLDVVVAQIREVARRYHPAGFFLDIVNPAPCWCNKCTRERIEAGNDPRDPLVIRDQARRVYLNYARLVREALDSVAPGIDVFHNGGHIRRGDREVAECNTILELESLPTGGYGYDHFPLSAAYVENLGLPYLGMTGKFHTTWGEFGGYKHPNALRYEAASAVAQGARLSVGDQLHPDGSMDEATYGLIGEAYAEVRAKEPWLVGAARRADVGVLSLEAFTADREIDWVIERPKQTSDEGVTRMLLEEHVQFHMLDRASSLSRYSVLILPDRIRLDEPTKEKLRDFVRNGGRLIASGESGLDVGSDVLGADFGVIDKGVSAYNPEYIVTEAPLPPWGQAAHVLYAAGRLWQLEGGQALGWREEPYFNRDLLNFCSHQHAPNRKGVKEPVVVRGPAGVAFAHPIFSLYAESGALALRKLFRLALDCVLPAPLVKVDAPAAARVYLSQQAAAHRDIVHVLHASPVRRGAGIEIIEDLVPLRDVKVAVRTTEAPASVTLQPQGVNIDFAQEGTYTVFNVPQVMCHQMIALSR